MRPDRIVCGADSEQAIDTLTRIYTPLAQRGYRVLFTEIETAEVIKYAANAFLAVKISYINEIADLCEVVGADVDSVAAAIGMDRRIGPAFLRAGPGWGGSCFPKDTRALKAIADDHVVSLRIVDAAIEANMQRRDLILQKIEIACGGSVSGKRLAVFGLTFKGQTDDIRESPSIELIRELAERGARIRAYDPSHPADARRMLPGLVMTKTAVDAVRSGDGLIVLTDWKDFLKLDLGELAAYMANPVLIDIRNLFDEGVARMAGFDHYVRVGRRSVVIPKLIPSQSGPQESPAQLGGVRKILSLVNDTASVAN
jgi:UDPglucose 6-dehydrogenase